MDQNGNDDEKPRTLFVGNLPADVKKREVEDLFGDIGPLKRCHLQYPRKGGGGREALVAYVTYALTEDATAAATKFANHRLEGNKLNVKLVKSRSDSFRSPSERVPAANVEKPKKPRQKKNTKKARLIVRNISFQSTEEKLREHFATCGDVKDVNILRKPNGKLVGCAFIQYANVFEAMKALKTLNAKPLLDRTVVIDWAVPKEKYKNKGNEPEEDEEEEEEDSKPDVKDVKPDLTDGEGSEDEDEKFDLDDDDDDEEEEDIKPDLRKRQSNDADEGKTLFIRNLSFDTEQEGLKQFFEKFGDLQYALICKDSLTEHPKGTAFVKYKDPESAQKCMSAYEEDESDFTLDSRQFYISLAMSKKRLEEKLDSKKEDKTKDNRRLYLSREGFVRPGSEAAFGVSITDMNKRGVLHQRKKQMLKDLSVFISDTRLCVHNIPPNVDDAELKKIFKKFSGPKAVITEARVMRDLSTLDKVSKEFGFVTFKSHEDALKALRTVNNNPNIFTPNRRPIVEFSMENRKALNAKERRSQKSLEMLRRKQQSAESAESSEAAPTNKKSKGKRKATDETETGAEVSSQENTDPPRRKKQRKRDEEPVPEFGGLTGKKGITKLPSFKGKGKISRKALKTPKKKLQSRRMREGKTKSLRKIDGEDKLDKLVQQRKATSEGMKGKGKKWFE